MATRNHLSPVRGYGSMAIAGCRFTPGASTAAIVTSESWGIASIVRTNTGVYTITLRGKPKGFLVVAVGQDNGTTHYHQVRCDSQSDSAGTAVITIKSVAVADVASGMAATDTIDDVVVTFYERGE